MSTRFQRALLSCLFVQTFLAASVPVMAVEPTRSECRTRQQFVDHH